MATTILFIVSFVAACAIFSYALSGYTKRNAVAMLPFGITAVIAVNCFIGFVAQIISVRMDALPTAVENLVLSVLIILYLRKSGLSKSTAESIASAKKETLKTSISFVVLFVFICAIGLLQFGVGLSPNYASTDGSSHFWSAMATAFEQYPLTSMFLTHYETALWIQCMVPLLDFYDYVKVFIVVDLAFLLLQGMVFYVVFQEATHKQSLIFASVFSILFVAGYPLNNTVFGFSYLGAGVLYVMTFFGMILYMNQTEGGKEKAVLGAVTVLYAYGVCISYYLFVPILLMQFVLIRLVRMGEKRGFKTALIAALILGVCACLAVALVVKSGIVAELVTDGYIFKDLYNSFILISIPGIFGFVFCLKTKEKMLSSFFVAVLACCIVFLVLLILGYASTYYYFKFYYVLWFAFFLCAGVGFVNLLQNWKVFACTTSVIVVVLLAFSLSGMEQKVIDKYPDLAMHTKPNNLLAVYNFNKTEVRSTPITAEELELYREAGELAKSHNEYIPMLGSNISVYWYEAITNRHCDDRHYFHYWTYKDEHPEKLLQNRLAGSDYLVALDGHDKVSNMEDYLKGKKVVFQNPAGKIVELR